MSTCHCHIRPAHTQNYCSAREFFWTRVGYRSAGSTGHALVLWRNVRWSATLLSWSSACSCKLWPIVIDTPIHCVLPRPRDHAEHITDLPRVINHYGRHTHVLTSSQCHTNSVTVCYLLIYYVFDSSQLQPFVSISYFRFIHHSASSIIPLWSHFLAFLVSYIL